MADDIKEKALKKHEELKGKLEVVSKDPLETQEALSTFYTPGVATVSSHVAEHPEDYAKYTGVNNSIAIISDGSAVLGLGDIGPKGAMPVMEGKAMLFKRFAGIDGYPVVLDVHTADEIVNTVLAIAPSYGGINLEDIAAPLCFEVEERVKEALDIPVMHDDQHGTAVVVLAGLINALKIVDKNLEDLKVVTIGAGAAGVAITKLLNKSGVKEILNVDSKGIINSDRDDLNESKRILLEFTNPNNVSGSIDEALEGADVVIGVSRGGLLGEDHIKSMADKAIVFALANPTPEIMPDVALSAGAAVVATGRSDFPNQVNNALAFPGIFRGALDNKVSKITDDHKIAAAKALAGLVENPTPDKIIPSVLDENIVPKIAKVIV